MTRPGTGALAYLITFSCYGTRIHGSERGSVDRDHNTPKTPWLSASAARLKTEESLMRHEPFRLDKESRQVVRDAIQAVCVHREWSLLAAHVRTTHVHAVVAADAHPQRIMVDFKAYASRALTQGCSGQLGNKALEPPWEHAVLVGAGECAGRGILCFIGAR